jgi:hypothetical protein
MNRQNSAPDWLSPNEFVRAFTNRHQLQLA